MGSVTSQMGYIVTLVGFGLIVIVWMAQWKRETKTTLNAIQKTAHDIYLLSNSHMAEQLRLNVSVTSRLAELTGKDEDVKEADKSRRMYGEHQKRQAVVDKG